MNGPLRWRTFVERFHETYFDVIASDDLKHLSRLEPESLMEFAMLMLYGNHSMSMMKLLVKHVLMKIFDLKALDPRPASVMLNNTAIAYASSHIHIEIDFDGMDATIANTVVCEFFAKQIATSRCYGQRKHVVVMYNLDKLPRQTAMALRKLVETCSKSVVCVATCTNTSKISDALRSRCAFIKCNVSKQRQQTLLKMLGVDITLESLTAPLTTIICGSSVTLLDVILEDLIDVKFPECGGVLDAVGVIKKVVVHIMRFGYNVAQVIKTTVSVLCKKETGYFDCDLTGLIETAATIEHASTLHRDIILALESFFLHVYRFRVRV